MNSWPDEKRIDIIGANGNDGLHYVLERIDKEIAVLEQQLEDLNESRREYINRNNLNRELKNGN